VRVTGGLAAGGLRYAAETGAETIQVFVSSPRGWALSPGDTTQDAALRDHVAGHDLAARGGVTGLLDALAPIVQRRQGSGSRLRLIHANDSKDGCGSRRDRHENIGAGRIGTAPFAALLRHPATGGVPFIVETPGPRAAVAADVATLKALRGKGRPSRTPAAGMR